jgi:hypothetical protein
MQYQVDLDAAHYSQRDVLVPIGSVRKVDAGHERFAHSASLGPASRYAEPIIQTDEMIKIFSITKLIADMGPRRSIQGGG